MLCLPPLRCSGGSCSCIGRAAGEGPWIHPIDQGVPVGHTFVRGLDLPRPVPLHPSPGGQIEFPGGIGGPRARSAPPSPTAQSSVPEDIPDARDDDVVARQLREAAMNETDPELKEKLWEEYRRYKGS